MSCAAAGDLRALAAIKQGHRVARLLELRGSNPAELRLNSNSEVTTAFPNSTTLPIARRLFFRFAAQAPGFNRCEVAQWGACWKTSKQA